MLLRSDSEYNTFALGVARVQLQQLNTREHDNHDRFSSRGRRVYIKKTKVLEKGPHF
jgi:hypothetical protein